MINIAASFSVVAWTFAVGITILVGYWGMEIVVLNARFVASRRAERRRLGALEKAVNNHAATFEGVSSYMTDMLGALVPLLDERVEALAATERHMSAVIDVHERRAAYLEALKASPPGTAIQPEAAGFGPQIVELLQKVDAETFERLVSQHLALAIGARDHFKAARHGILTSMEKYAGAKAALVGPVATADPTPLKEAAAQLDAAAQTK